MATVKLTRGKDIWHILVPDVSDADAEAHALRLANGDDEGRDRILPTNGRTVEQMHADRRALADNKKPRKLTAAQTWEVAEVLPDEDFPSSPDNIAAAEKAARAAAEQPTATGKPRKSE